MERPERMPGESTSEFMARWSDWNDHLRRLKREARKATRRRRERVALEEREFVFVERARCPGCGSIDLETQRSVTDGERSEKKTKCRQCGKNFSVILE